MSGPGPVVFDDSTKLKTSAIANTGGEYIFKLSVDCETGQASQEVKHIVSAGAAPDAGDDVFVDCFDADFSLPLSGSTPPTGFTSYWTVPNGTVVNNIYRPKFDNIETCPNTITTLVLQYNLIDNNNCVYSDTKALTFKEYVPPLKLNTAGGCGQSFKLSATCTGNGAGKWTFISPADGGGASFDSPNQRVTGITNGNPEQEYIVSFSITGSCHDQTDTIKFKIPADSEDVSQADFLNIITLFNDVKKEKKGKTITYTVNICGIPDSLLILADTANLIAGEKTSWTFTKMKCSIWYGEIQSDPLFFNPDNFSAFLDNLEVGTYALTYKVINKSGCETTADIILSLIHI